MIFNQVVKGGGTTPTGTIQITTNGTHDVAAYANADVNVPTTAPASYRAFQLDSGGKLVNSTSTPPVPLPAGTTDIDSYLLASAYKGIPSTIISGGIDLSGLTQISGTYAIYSAFENCPGITSVNLSSLQSVNGVSGLESAFRLCTNMTSVDLSSLAGPFGYTALRRAFEGTGVTRVSLPRLKNILTNDVFYNAFQQCSSLTTVDLSSLEVVYGPGCMIYCFANCSALTTFDLSKFVSSPNTGNSNNCLQYCFLNCSSLTKASFPSLKIITSGGLFAYCFSGCTSLTEVFFPALSSTGFGSKINQFNSMLAYCSNVTIHFPKNLDPQSGSTCISSLSGYPNFGGTNTVLAFDCPSTSILSGANNTEYERSPKDDTVTALAWRVKDTGSSWSIVIDWTPFYTSGTSDPVVGDTIYSDSACTTAVTTISTIA